MVIGSLADIVGQQAVHKSLREAIGGTATQVGVAVRDGIVTLSGTVATVGAKFAAEDAAQRVPGVRAVANDLSVRRVGESSAAELARRIVAALGELELGPDAALAVGVQSGWVRLRGTVGHDADRIAAAACLRRLPGVKGVVDEVAVRPVVPAALATLLPVVPSTPLRPRLIFERRAEPPAESGARPFASTVPG